MKISSAFFCSFVLAAAFLLQTALSNDESKRLAILFTINFSFFVLIFVFLSLGAVSQKIQHAKDLLEELKAKSDQLNCKVDDISQVIEDFKCAFKTLEDDVEVLESAKNHLQSLETPTLAEVEEFADDFEDDLDDVEDDVEDKKKWANLVHDFSHPCGGWGWTRIFYADFRRDDTDCDILGAATTGTGVGSKPHACLSSIASGGPSCLAAPSISTNGLSYSSVCGRICAYQIGSPHAFDNFINGGQTNLNQPYLSGISLTTDSMSTHIWSFPIGLTQSQAGASDADFNCPCDADPAAVPPFVGEDYFCESAITAALDLGGTGDPAANAFDGDPFLGNKLWDGLGCTSSSQCCSRIHHPYFVRHLGMTTSADIELRTCFTDTNTAEGIAIELIEIYVK